MAGKRPGAGVRAKAALKPVDVGTARAIAGGRVTVDSLESVRGFHQTIVAPDSSEDYWRWSNLDSQTLDRIPVNKLVDLLADLSDSVSKGLWDFLRFCNPGFEITAHVPGGETEHVQGKAGLARINARLVARHGALDIPIGRLFLGLFLRGAFVLEGVLDQAGRELIDLATPDASTVRFRKSVDPVLGDVYVPGQWRGGKFRDFDRDTIVYMPMDPLPGKPYGRAPVAPAVFMALFLLGLLHDLRRVVSQQGYPRLDLEINLEKLLAAMPEEDREDPAALKAWVTAAVNEVKTIYAGLEPDDAYIHTDVVKVNRPVGTVDASSLKGASELIERLERMLVRALKTAPLLQALTDGVSEANANRQWEMLGAGIQAVQHLVETALGRILEVGLQAEGIVCDVRVRFAKLRASERMRDAQTEQLEIANAIAKYTAGWISQDEAAQRVTGHDADQEEPRGEAAAPEPAEDADPGASRGVRAKFVPLEGPPVSAPPDSVVITDADLEDAAKAWNRAMPARYRGLLDATVKA